MNEKTLILSSLIVAGLVLGAAGFTILQDPAESFSYDIKSFADYTEYQGFLASNHDSGQGSNAFYEMDGMLTLGESSSSETPSSSRSDGTSSGSASNADYSETNVQVDGVDEPDIIKTDGTYLYISEGFTVFIVKAYPAEDAGVVATIEVDKDHCINGLFIYGNTLALLTSGWDMDGYSYNHWYSGSGQSGIELYDVSNHMAPVLSKSVSIEGNYFDSRMIDGTIYMIATEYTYALQPVEENETWRIPEICIDGESEQIEPASMCYIDIPEPLDVMTHVLSLDITTEEINHKTFLLGSSGCQNMYVSADDIYITTMYYNYGPIFFLESADSEVKDNQIKEDTEHTTIHRINIADQDITYAACGDVPGRIINQFSMDSYNNNFRIATTIGHVWDSQNPSSNNIYVLDSDLVILGSVEGIALGEEIYSSRFVGDKAYVVTFKNTDPFYVIDLSVPNDPKIAGYLKLPGYSDYLHPFDDTHIIGIGKDTVEIQEGDGWWSGRNFAWYQGLKLALFDVEDPSNPALVDTVIIGDRGTDSIALWNHKAFLFDKDKELLVIPVTVHELPESVKAENDNYTGGAYGEYTFDGVYIYQLTEEGFTLRGNVTHQDGEISGIFYGNDYAVRELDSGNDSDLVDEKPDEDDEIIDLVITRDFIDYWSQGDYNKYIHRSLYIGDNLYTISNNMVKIHDLNTLEEMGSIILA